jgi:sugar phosphate isomerase/epimerase
MTLVNNSDCLWDHVQRERDLENLGVSLDIGHQRQQGVNTDVVDEILNLI